MPLRKSSRMIHERNSRLPFIELARAAEINELDFGWWRIHVKVNWRPKGWSEAEHQERLSQWWSWEYMLPSRTKPLGDRCANTNLHQGDIVKASSRVRLL